LSANVGTNQNSTTKSGSGIPELQAPDIKTMSIIWAKYQGELYLHRTLLYSCNTDICFTPLNGYFLPQCTQFSSAK